MFQHLATEAQLVTFFEVSSNFAYNVSNSSTNMTETVSVQFDTQPAS